MLGEFAILSTPPSVVLPDRLELLLPTDATTGADEWENAGTVVFPVSDGAALEIILTADAEDRLADEGDIDLELELLAAAVVSQAQSVDGTLLPDISIEVRSHDGRHLLRTNESRN